MAGKIFGRAQGGHDAARHGDVVVLDQDGVVEAEAMVHAAAAAHRVFFKRAQTRRGFARAADFRLGVGDGLRIVRGQRGHAAQASEKVQRHPLRRQNAPRGALDAGDDGAGGEMIAVAGQGLEGQGGIDQFERLFRQIEPGQHARLFPRGDHGAGAGFGRNGRLRGDVAGAAKILIERGANRLFDEEGIKHGQGHGISLRGQAFRAQGERFVQRDAGAVRLRRIGLRIVGAEMPAPAFATIVGGGGDQQRRLGAIAQVEIFARDGFFAQAQQPDDGLAQTRLVAQHADMALHDLADFAGAGGVGRDGAGRGRRRFRRGQRRPGRS